MKAHIVLIVSLFVVLLTTVPKRADAQTEIVISGPWILYQDNQFMGTGGKPMSVLIAIAPTDAIDYDDLAYRPDPDADGMHHRPPQLSTGDGYYITQQNIYCLALPTQHGDPLQCAPPAPTSSPVSGNYIPIQVPHKGTHWNWWTVAQSDNQPQAALILPMPDSISNDGTWGVKFAPQFDVTGETYIYDYYSDQNGKKHDIPEHSTGLILHYQKALNNFGLVKCTAKPVAVNYFGVGDCNQPATGNDNRTDTYLENSGTLRLQMKAPDPDESDDSGCDIHVRMAHRKIAYLLRSFIEARLKFIEPAYYVDADNTAFDNAGNKHPCLSAELTDIGSDLELLSDMNIQGMRTRGRLGENLPPTADDLDGLLNDFKQFRTDLLSDLEIEKKSSFADYAKSDNKYDLEDFTLAEQSVTQARDIRRSFNKNFPRISQIRRIATLLQISHEAITREKNQPINRTLHKAWIDLSEIYHQLENDNGPGKSSGDCLANVMLVTDTP